MLAMSPLFPSLGWEYPLEIGSQQTFNLDHNWNLDTLMIPNYSTFQAQASAQAQIQAHHGEQDQRLIKRSESPVSASSAGHVCTAVITKKINHNASERDRRKRINSLYSSLRAVLPVNGNMKKLSIPATVSRVLTYIPELRKEVDNLIYRKDELLKKISGLNGATSEPNQEEKLTTNNTKQKQQSCSISVNKLKDREIVIQISTLERLSLSDVLLQLENHGFLVLNVSTNQSFGGSTFYNLHLWVDGCNIVKCEKLSEDIMIMIQKQNQHVQHSTYF